MEKLEVGGSEQHRFSVRKSTGITGYDELWEEDVNKQLNLDRDIFFPSLLQLLICRKTEYNFESFFF